MDFVGPLSKGSGWARYIPCIVGHLTKRGEVGVVAYNSGITIVKMIQDWVESWGCEE